MKAQCMGAYFAGGFGGVLAGAADIDRASPEQFVKMAQDMGIDLYRYQVNK